MVDFGGLGYIKEWIAENLDHACLFNESDPEMEKLLKDHGGLFKTYVLPNCSCEGVAEHLYGIFNPMVQKETDGRVWIVDLEIEEDSKNSAKFTKAE